MNLFDALLREMTVYGPLVLFVAMLPAGVGLPLPVGMLLIAAGALVRQGTMDWRPAFLFAWAGATVSDALCYGLGRWARRWAQDRLSGRYAGVWQRAEDLFRDRAGWAVFLTSWLIRSLAIPTNLIAGSSGYHFRRFIAWHAAGKVLYVLLHAGLGYAFASQWRAVAELIRRRTLLVGTCAAAGIGVYFLVRHLRGRRADAAGRTGQP